MSPVIRGRPGVIEFCQPAAARLGLEVEIENCERPTFSKTSYLAVAITRSPHGQVVTYPATFHEHYRGRLSSRLLADQSVGARLQELTIEQIHHLGLMGSSTLIFDESLEVIEIIQGVSDESLWTLDFAYVSQFENEVRAAHDLPLGASNPMISDWFAMAYSAPLNLDMKSPYLHLFAHDPRYKIHQLSTHSGIILTSGGLGVEERIRHAVDYLEGVINE